MVSDIMAWLCTQCSCQTVHAMFADMCKVDITESETIVNIKPASMHGNRMVDLHNVQQA